MSILTKNIDKKSIWCKIYGNKKSKKEEKMSKKMTGVVCLLTILTSEAALRIRATEGKTELKERKRELAKKLALEGEREEENIMGDLKRVMNRGFRSMDGRKDLIQEMKKQKLIKDKEKTETRALSLYEKAFDDFIRLKVVIREVRIEEKDIDQENTGLSEIKNRLSNFAEEMWPQVVRVLGERFDGGSAKENLNSLVELEITNRLSKERREIEKKSLKITKTC